MSTRTGIPRESKGRGWLALGTRCVVIARQLLHPHPLAYATQTHTHFTVAVVVLPTLVNHLTSNVRRWQALSFPNSTKQSTNKQALRYKVKLNGGQLQKRVPIISFHEQQRLGQTDLSCMCVFLHQLLRIFINRSVFIITTTPTPSPISTSFSAPLAISARSTATTMMLFTVYAFLLIAGVSANFYTDFDITWGNDHAKIGDNGQQLQLTLDRTSGSGFQSKNEYLFAQIDMQIKLVPGDSAGTVTAYYLSSQGSNHDEIDFEFLGNVSGEPYILHTNIFSQGLGNREQQFYLWFDPTKDFHTYSVLWNPQQILLSVDGTPIRVYRNSEDLGVSYPNKQRMRVYSSLWNADDWATRGGLVKIDWTKAPFVASYRNFKAQSLGTNAQTAAEYSTQEQVQKLEWVRKNYMIYDYCADTKRFPQGFPKECSRQS